MYQQGNFFKVNFINSANYKAVAGNVTNAFNEYIMLFVEYGLSGLIIFISGIWIILRNPVRTTDQYSNLTLLLISISAIFYYSFHVTIIDIMIVAMLSQLNNTVINIKFKSFSYLVTHLVLVSFSFMGVTYYCIGQYEATTIWKIANDKWPRDRQTSLALLSYAYPPLKYRSNFLFNYGALYFRCRDYKNSIKILNQCSTLSPSADLFLYLGNGYQYCHQMNLAEDCYKKAIYFIPSKYYPYYFLFHLYLENNKEIQAYNTAKAILSMPIKIPSIEVNNIKMEMAQFVKNH